MFINCVSDRVWVKKRPRNTALECSKCITYSKPLYRDSKPIIRIGRKQNRKGWPPLQFFQKMRVAREVGRHLPTCFQGQEVGKE